MEIGLIGTKQINYLRNEMSKLSRIFFIVGLSLIQVTAIAKTVTIKKETPAYVIDISYPQGFSSREINTSIVELIESIRKEQANPEKIDPDVPGSLPGKNGLYIKYKTMYQNKQVLSIQFDISSFSKGAAHPSNTVRTINFVHGKKVVLEQLFKPDSNYLAKISSSCRDQLLAKKDADEKWVLTGTAPTEDNYKNWYFSKKGIVVVFDTYQVAAYVYGPQTVLVSLPVMADLLQADFKKLIWGN